MIPDKTMALSEAWPDTYGEGITLITTLTYLKNSLAAEAPSLKTSSQGTSLK